MTEAAVYAVLILLCLVAEAFFSGTETGMISLNRPRLRHQAVVFRPREGDLKYAERGLGARGQAVLALWAAKLESSP